jgi:hypothetical protein
MITKTDHNLLVRVAKHLRTAAEREAAAYGENWGANHGARKAKARHDRLLCDERDLKVLRERLLKPAP